MRRAGRPPQQIDRKARLAYLTRMSRLPIITIPDPLLRQVSAPVEKIDEELHRLAADMLETMYAASGVGLAAVQIGVPRRLIVLDALEMSWRSIDVRPDPSRVEVTGLVATAAAEAFATLPPSGAGGGVVSARELADLLGARARGEADFLLVDVRGADEAAVVAIPGAQVVPLPSLDGLAGAAGTAGAWPRGQRVVLYCKSGARSAQALDMLLGAGFTDVQHLEGGVLAWVRDVDPSLPRY